MSSLPETKPLPPPARRGTPPASPVVAVAPISLADRFVATSVLAPRGERVMIYGPGGIGKSCLASLAPGAVFLDLEDSTTHFTTTRIPGVENWADLRACLQSHALDAYKTIVIDSITRAEEWAVAHTLATVPHEKGNKVTNLESYGFGKGQGHVYDTFGLILPDLDRHIRAGRNVVLIAHECVADVPNPAGEDFIRYEPHLQAPKSGKASIRERVFQWVDHCIFVAYDVVTKDNKGLGGGTRTAWPVERPDHRAKSRSMAEPIVFENATDGAIWPLLLGGAA